MIGKPKIFVSYSFNEPSLMEALKSRLEKTGFAVHINTGVPHTDDLHRAISANLGQSDIVIPIISSHWLESHECRDELVRAHERKKLIVPFVDRSVLHDSSHPMPWYIRSILQVEYTSRDWDRALDELVEKLNNMKLDSWKTKCYSDIQLISDNIKTYKGNAPIWQSSLCQRALSLAEEQIHNILATNKCKFEVAYERAYLDFAQPIFGQAKSIIAICIASTSTYWTNPSFRADAADYLEQQKNSADSIMRLFVFNSLNELTKFRQTLKRNYEAYGNPNKNRNRQKNGIFLCSTNSYAELLKRWALVSNTLEQDFGLLSFDDTDIRMYATLDKIYFEYLTYKENDNTSTRYQLVNKFFRELQNLKAGAFHEESCVVRWHPDWSHDNAKLHRAGTKLFEDRHQQARHTVLIKAETDSEDVSNYLRQLASLFDQKKDDLKIRTISLKKRSDMAPTDGRYAASILSEQNFDYCLSMTFADEHAMRHYYEHEIHSRERERLYIFLNPATRPLFEQAAAMPRHDRTARAFVFMKIEKMMRDGGYIQRIDIRDDDSLFYPLNW